MKNRFQIASCVFPALLTAALTPIASAGCGDTSQLQAPFTFVQLGSSAQAVVERANEAARAASSNPLINTATMVGFWRIQFISQGNTTHNPSIPDGAQVDFGYTQWHSDGNEILNSGGRAPATENFCLGVWVRTGYFTYELSHFALGYDATSGMLNGKTNIREQVTLDPSGNLFTGTFTITVFNPTTGVQVDRIVGTLAGQRITVDQTAP